MMNKGLKEFQDYVQENANIQDFTIVWKWLRGYKNSFEPPHNKNPKVIINKEAKEVCCANCVSFKFHPHTHPCNSCFTTYNKFKQNG